MSHWHSRTQKVRIAQSEITSMVMRYAGAEGLTNIELLQALAEAQGSLLKQMLRTERHPNDPDKGADEP